MKAVLYIHGKGGSAAESEHCKPLFPGCRVMGLDYQASTPWDAAKELRAGAEALHGEYGSIILVANSIGAYFSMCAGLDAFVEEAYFISPIVDMEELIRTMMGWAGVTEAELTERGVIETSFGETLSREYLRYVREHSVVWRAPTRILYGGRDDLTSRETVGAFVQAHGASLTVMEEGEHWFHTPEQVAFLDDWIRSGIKEKEKRT